MSSSSQQRLFQKWATMWVFARALAELSTAKIRKVGCVIFHPAATRVYGIGYNGQAAGVAHDRSGDDPLVPSGDLHAEVNALMKCPALGMRSSVCITTFLPCLTCAGYIINSRHVSLVIYGGDFAMMTHPKWGAGHRLLRAAGIETIHMDHLDGYEGVWTNLPNDSV